MMSILLQGKKTFSGYLAIALAIGCAVSIAPAIAAEDANKGFDASYVQANLIEDKTTKAEVEKKFGKPTSVNKTVRKDGVEEIWEYDATQKTARGKFRKFSSLVSKAGDALPESMRTKWLGSQAAQTHNQARNAEQRVSNAEDVGKGASGDNGSNDSFMYLRVVFRNGVVEYFSLT